MPTDVVMPQMGESIFEGTITKWLKKPGDTVQRDEPLFEISTDKVDAEIPSPAAGTLTEIKVGEGTTVQINTVVAVHLRRAAARPLSSLQGSFSRPSPKRLPRRRQQKPAADDTFGVCIRQGHRRRRCRRWANPSLRAPSRNGSRKSATPCSG